MIFVETKNGRNIACSKITFEIKQTGYWVHLWRDEDGHEFEYELIHISMITKVYKLKED